MTKATMFGSWKIFDTGLETYMRRRVFGMFWFYRRATDEEVRARITYDR